MKLEGFRGPFRFNVFNNAGTLRRVANAGTFRTVAGELIELAVENSSDLQNPSSDVKLGKLHSVRVRPKDRESRQRGTFMSEGSPQKQEVRRDGGSSTDTACPRRQDLPERTIHRDFKAGRFRDRALARNKRSCLLIDV
jgi:hypothetical protein